MGSPVLLRSPRQAGSDWSSYRLRGEGGDGSEEKDKELGIQWVGWGERGGLSAEGEGERIPEVDGAQWRVQGGGSTVAFSGGHKHRFLPLTLIFNL